jgi:hypothetical protein
MRVGSEGILDPPDPSKSPGDNEIEQTTHSFVLRIWREESLSPGKSATWRGHITHIPSNKRRSVRHVGEIIRFIEPYLEQLGMRTSCRERVQQWVRCWRCPTRE